MSRGMVIRAARKIAVQNGIHDEGEENRCVGDDKGDPPPEIRAARVTAFRGRPRPFDRYAWPGGDKLVCAHPQALPSSDGSNDECEDIADKGSGRVADCLVLRRGLRPFPNLATLLDEKSDDREGCDAINPPPARHEKLSD